MKRAALYVRVSTDRQTVENQIARLTEIATARGWKIIDIFSDAGIGGAKGRKDRPGLDEMLKQAQRHRFDVVMAWAIDRIGRSLIDLLGTIQHLQACGVDLYLDQQAIDTTTPAGKLMFQVTGAFAEFERSLIRQRIHAGLKRAVDNGKILGRPLNNPEALDKARQLLSRGLGINKVARQVGLSNTTVARLKAEKEARPPPASDCPADLPKCGSLRRGDHETTPRGATALPNGLKNDSLIAVSDVDRIFNDLQNKKLADTLKLGASGDDPRFAQSIRQDVRLHRGEGPPKQCKTARSNQRALPAHEQPYTSA
jgi:DNA invertase Pin-like site-specific DNA recombinase